MRPWLAFVTGVLFVAGASASAGQARLVREKVPADLQQASRDRNRAIQEVDSATWDRLTSDEFTIVTASGALVSKADRLSRFKADKPSTSTRSDEQLIVYGNSAVERFKTSAGLWVMQMWVKQPQGWQVVMTQLTMAASRF